MARNKHPEETVEKILTVSFKLFREKGYEHTTIQDIVDALGMSKGAVYHHFKSKEEILDRISDAYYDDVQMFQDTRLDPGLNGLEKLRRIITFLLSDRDKLELDRFSLPLAKNDKLVALTLRSTIEDAAPFLQEIIEDGVADGSITTRQPGEMAEAFLILMNLWIGINTRSREDFVRKIAFCKELTDKMGLPVFDDALVQTSMGYFESVICRDPPQNQAP